MNRLPLPGGSTSDSGMGIFRVPIQVGKREGDRFTSLDALVDTGAMYTWIPSDVLTRLGVVPEEEWPFELADGREVRYDVAWITIGIGKRTQPTIAVFGVPGTEALLGAFTLEAFLLAADPVNQRLIPVRGLLMAAR